MLLTIYAAALRFTPLMLPRYAHVTRCRCCFTLLMPCAIVSIAAMLRHAAAVTAPPRITLYVDAAAMMRATLDEPHAAADAPADTMPTLFSR